jgi:hypothetical protein
MAKIDLSLRDRHGIKWHLNIQQFDRAEGRRLDKVFDALKLDNVTTTQQADPATLDVALVEYELTSDERDFLIDNLQKPAMGYIKRLLSPIERALIKSRDGETPT